MMDSNTDNTKTPGTAEAVVIRESEIFADPEFTNGDPTLNDAEVAFFKENGFLVKRGFLYENKTFERIVDYVWENVPRGVLKRDDPQTWLDGPHEEWTEEDAETVGQLKRGGWMIRSKGGIGTESFFVDAIANNSRMRKLVASFIGEPVRHLRRVRGVYVQFPKAPDTERRLGPHADGTAAQLTAMVLVDDVAPHCGGFTIWPGSHHRLHPHFVSIFGGRRPEDDDAYDHARDTAIRDITPLEFPGKAGDVIFWHPRLIHSPGINRSAELGKPTMRLIVPCDYQRDGLTLFDDAERGPGPERQWWIDTRNHREDVPSTPNNIWHGWAFD
jgi:hypothetical protein